VPSGGRRSVRLFGRSSWPEAGRIAEILRKETIGGLLLLLATAVALAFANSPWSRDADDLLELIQKTLEPRGSPRRV
jgi:NhaA family Na+:H+ antiporter